MASAATYVGGRWFNGNITYYNATTAPYSTAFTAAKNRWNSDTNLNLTGDTSASANVRVSTLYRTDSTAGVTMYSPVNGLGYFTGQNTSYFNTYNSASLSANCQRMVITHELGHAVSLDDRAGAYVMRPTVVDCETRYNPESGDITAINARY